MVSVGVLRLWSASGCAVGLGPDRPAGGAAADGSDADDDADVDLDAAGPAGP
jgi:hypothetical protein